ncbi:hypothetical protein HDU83_006881 [Entophlyctis luteolus]|nr:hypothetical protein HDU82_006690 [Entophlyctis luteolus]KAJ3353396.1 hypothetical protein HDU83_006881 [Entophlyctis luteolus]KAJ3380945.1 hypothetical protein HDU84_005442 [Entophlyctis sp. JEL0112]
MNVNGTANGLPFVTFSIADLYPDMFPDFVSYWVFSALTGLTTIVFTILVYIYDRKKMFSPFNIQLFFMGLCVTASSFDMICPFYFCNYDAAIVKYGALGGFEYCYILYAFGRSKGVIQRVSTTLLSCLDWFVKLAPLVLLLQIIGPVLALAGVINKFFWPYWVIVLPSVSGFSVFLFDFALLIAFLAYVYNSSDFDSPNRRTFVTIAYFGIIACLLWVISCGLFMCGQLMFLDASTYMKLTIASYLADLAIILVLILMKVWLSRRGSRGSEQSKTAHSKGTEKTTKN